MLHGILKDLVPGPRRLLAYHLFLCEDFGHIVFAMVEAGMMFKTEEDSIKDFQGVYDFSDAFSPRLQLDEKR